MATVIHLVSEGLIWTEGIGRTLCLFECCLVSLPFVSPLLLFFSAQWFMCVFVHRVSKKLCKIVLRIFIFILTDVGSYVVVFT